MSMFPLVSAELSFEFDADRTLIHGTLPMVVTGDDAEGYLRTYAETYLDQEIRAEALTRNIGAFARFLEVENSAGVASRHRSSVHWCSVVIIWVKLMRNITLSADEHLIDMARSKAQQKNSTLNAEFRKWLESYINSASSSKRRVQTYRSLMSELSEVSTGGRTFTRDEMNER